MLALQPRSLTPFSRAKETEAHYPYILSEVKKRRRGSSRISSKHQITIPIEGLRSAGLEVGDRVVAHSDGAGRVVLEREPDVVAELAGALTGVYTRNQLDDLRAEWD